MGLGAQRIAVAVFGSGTEARKVAAPLRIYGIASIVEYTAGGPTLCVKQDDGGRPNGYAHGEGVHHQVVNAP